MNFTYTITAHKPGHREPFVYSTNNFASGADLIRWIDSNGWPREITGSEPIFARLEI